MALNLPIEPAPFAKQIGNGISFELTPMGIINNLRWNMTIENLLAIELYYETQSGSFSHPFELFMKESLILLKFNQYEDFYSRSEVFINSLGPNSHLERGGCLIWTIVATEIQFDLAKREKYLKLFIDCANDNLIPHFEFYRFYFTGITYGYSSQQIESEAFFKKALHIAESLNYTRGIARALLHMGIIQSEMGNAVESQKSLLQASQICSQNNLTTTLRKINLFLDKDDLLQNNASEDTLDIASLRKEVVNLIKLGDLSAARKKLVSAEIKRRQLKLLRKAQSLYILHGVIAALTGKLRISKMIFDKIDDQVLRLEYYELLKNAGFVFTHDVHARMDLLKMNILAMNRIHPIQLSAIRNVNVRKLVRLLFENNEPLNNALLFKKIFDIDYDPVIHDIKLYKLILQTRKLIGEDLIINHQGSYSCNKQKFKLVI